MRPGELAGVLGRAGLLGVAAAATAGAGIAALADAPVPHSLSGGLLCGGMAAAAVCDARVMRIPDLVSLPLVVLGLLVTGGRDGLIISPDHLAAAFVGAAALWGIRRWSAWRRGVPGLGLGDVKLAAVAGAWLGPEGLAPAIGLGALAGVLLHLAARRGRVAGGDVVAFGVTLAPAIALVWIWQLFVR